MIKLPIIKKIVIKKYFLYFNAVGNSSYNDIWIIIPAIIEYNKPIIISFTNGVKKRKANIAPNGSDKAEIKV